MFSTRDTASNFVLQITWIKHSMVLVNPCVKYALCTAMADGKLLSARYTGGRLLKHSSELKARLLQQQSLFCLHKPFAGCTV